MIYLDYAADTPVRREVLETFNRTCETYFANPNATHSLGRRSKACIDAITEEIAKLLGCHSEEIIYTSGATESNNLAIKGVAEQYGRKGKHMITSYLEHSSVTGPLNYLQQKGFEVDFVRVQPNGKIDLEHLKTLLRPDTILVSLAAIDSELGIIQDIHGIREVIKKYPNCLLHVDATQAVGKTKVAIQDVDLMTLTAHKLYGLHGIGVLIKKKPIYLTPIIHGGISTTPFRSGTPTLAHIVSLQKALALALEEQETVLERIKAYNKQLRTALTAYPKILMNSEESSATPYILNISLMGIKASQMQQKLEEQEIYVSTKSACVTPNTPSRPVLAVFNERKRALSTLRISLSYQTTQEEIDSFIEQFEMCYRALE